MPETIARCEWTIDTALAHLLALREADDRRYEQRFEAQGVALLKTETALERRFEGVNEFRATLADQQGRFIAKSEVDEMRRALEARTVDLKERLDALTAERKGIVGGWGYAVGVAGLVALAVSLAVTFMK
jgi:hypothetical protein